MIFVEIEQFPAHKQLLVKTTLDYAHGIRPVEHVQHVLQYGTLPPTVVPGGSNG